ncbi:MAG: PilZ domain-containing protein, partial [Campylobacterales bacterium]
NKLTKFDFDDFCEKKNEKKTHLTIFAIDNLDEERLRLLEIAIKKSPSWEYILFTDSSNDSSVLRFGIKNRFSDIIPKESSQRDIYEAYKKVLQSLLKKKKEKQKMRIYEKVVNNSGYSFFMTKDDKSIFYTGRAGDSCPVEDFKALVSEKKSGLVASSEGLELFQKVAWDELKDEMYLVNISKLNSQNENIGSCIKLDKSLKNALIKKDSLNRLNFIEVLKDALITQNVSEESLFISCIKVQNSNSIISEFGNDSYYSFTRELLDVCKQELHKESIATFWQGDYLVILLYQNNPKEITDNVDSLFDKLQYEKFEKDITPFLDLYILKINELDLNATVKLIEKFYDKSYGESEIENILLRKSTFATLDTDDRDKTMYYIENIYLKKHPIKLLNIYKGLSVNTSSSIIKIADDGIYVRTEKLQKYAMYLERGVVMQSPSLPKEIYAEVKYVDGSDSYAILTNPVFMEFTANNRTYARVQCDARIPTVITSAKHSYTGEMLDMSVKALAVRYKSNITKSILNHKAKITFSLPNKKSETGLDRLEIEGSIVAIINIENYTKVVVNITPDVTNEAKLLEYIYKRQKELIMELKKLGSVSFGAK